LAPFDYPRDEYFGIPLIDTINELRQLRDSDQKVWIIVHSDGDHLSPEVYDFLEKMYVKSYEVPYGSVYVNSAQ
jgi:hypothetical protein